MFLLKSTNQNKREYLPYKVNLLSLCRHTNLKLTMRYITLYTILLLLSGHILFAQSGVESCDSLVAKKQYLSAFDCLHGADSENENVDIVLKKVELALNHNVKTIRNHMFAFVDLREGEELDELKETLKDENFPFFAFKPDSVLLKLIPIYPNDYRLVKALGDFYYNTYKSMGDRWFIPARELLEKFNSYYSTAYENDIYDARSLYALAFYNSIFEDYDQAQKWYEKSLRLEPDDALTAYGAGANSLLNKNPEEGIKQMKHAYELFSDSLKKGDAARILGIMYYKTNSKEDALEMFKKADSLSPQYHPNQMFLLRSQLQMGKEEPALELAKVIFDQAPVDPDVPDELLEMFRREGEGELLETIFKSLLKEYKHNHEANGNLRFHYGKLLYLEGDSKKAVKMFKKSRSQFSKALPPEHHVFKMLDDMIEKINR